MEPLLRLNAYEVDDDEADVEMSPRQGTTSSTSSSVKGRIISCADALRHSKWTFLFYSIISCTIFTVLIAVHTFNSPTSTTYATCAATLSSGGPCAASGGAPCILRCPPRCDDIWLDSKVYTVYGGSQDTNFSYRGDSKLCRAAIHSGALSSSGGCTILRVGKSFAFFASESSSHNNIQTYDAPYFPYSLSFTKREESSSNGDCTSLQWPLLICLTIMIIIGLILVPAIPYVIIWSAMCVFSFWYLVFTARGSEPFSSFTIGAGSFVSLAPLLFCIWRACARVTIIDSKHSLVTLLFLYLLPFLAAIHMNLATVIVPDFSFDADVFSQGPKAIIFVIFIIILILTVLIYAIRLIVLSISSSASTAGVLFDIERGNELARRRRTIAFAALFYLFGIFILIFISVTTRKHTSPHVHHSLLALALLPLTSSTKRPMLIAQAILLGILINGIAFWGIDGPWNLVTPPTWIDDTPLCTPFIAYADTNSARIDWPCTPSLFGTSFALMINNIIVFNAFEPPAILSQLPEGYNGTMQLFQMLADGTLSRGSPIVPFHS